uniref:Trimethylguanosine synthase n=1 Tax=Tetraselmis sp. GSL018 TaxID=582737 RepID=A0A061RDW6_9CHLO
MGGSPGAAALGAAGGVEGLEGETDCDPAADTRDAGFMVMKKYWYQRFSLFSRFNDGIRMDEEAWYSVTPEAIANHQASRCACGVAVDAFAGAGGNSIALARTCGHVVAVDTSEQRLRLAKANAMVYGRAGAIDFVCADFLRLAPHLWADAVFLSPPWGGPSYSSHDTFSLEPDLGGMGIGLGELLEHALGIVARRKDRASQSEHGNAGIGCFLPRNTDVEQLQGIAKRQFQSQEFELEQNLLNGKIKGLTLYCGSFCDPKQNR